MRTTEREVKTIKTVVRNTVNGVITAEINVRTIETMFTLLETMTKRQKKTMSKLLIVEVQIGFLLQMFRKG